MNEKEAPILRVGSWTAFTCILLLLCGNYNNGTNCGITYLNANNGLTNGNWNYSRPIQTQIRTILIGKVKSKTFVKRSKEYRRSRIKNIQNCPTRE